MKNNYLVSSLLQQGDFLRKSFLLLMLFIIFSIGNIKAQVSGYVFSQSSGTYNELTGATVLGTATANTSAGSLDTSAYPVVLPFPFTFNSVSYTDISVNTNGYLTFGTTASTGSTPISSATAWGGVVSAFGGDLNSVFDIAGKTGTLSWEMVGTAPNREIVVQWKDFRPSYTVSTTAAYTFSFQIRLAETTNAVSVVYSSGSYLIGTTTYSGTRQIGLRGSTNTDFNNRTNTTTLLFDSSTAGTANNSTQAWNTVNATPGMPPAGLTYTWVPPTCVAPSGTAFTNITTAAVDVNWTTSVTPPADGYSIYYSTTNTAPNSTTVLDATNSVTSTTTNASISGLTTATTYYVWIRSNCSSTDFSNWLFVSSFTTACLPVSYMFENFDSYATGSIVPTCWVRMVAATTPGSQTITATTPASGIRNMYQYATATQTPVIVALPEFSNVNAGTHQLRFKLRVSAAPGAFEIGYVTDVTDASTYVAIENLAINNTTYTATDAEYSVIIPNTVPAGARLAFKNPADTKGYYWDDVYWEPVPTCFPPTALAVSTVGTNSADLTWTDPTAGVPGNGYDIYYSTTNTAPTPSTVLDATNSTTSTTNTVTVGGLSPSTTYYVWVRSVCSSTDQSSWINVSATFTTACVAIDTMFENFDSYATGNIVPTCWVRIAPATTPGSQTISSSTPASGTRNIYQYATATQTPVIVALPEFSNVNAGTHRLRFKMRVSAAPGAFEVGYVTNVLDGSTFVAIENLAINNITYTATDAEYSVIIPNTVPAGARLAFRNPADAKSYYWDDVYWEPVPTCLPPTSILIDNIAPTLATVSWTASTTPPTNGYEIYVSTSGTAPTATTVPTHVGISGTSQNITLLNPSTIYYVWVRANCATNDQSTWTVFKSFTTPCQPPMITGTTPATVCPGATATLGATADAGATINWYDAATGGNLLGTGGSYTTPSLSTTTSYYVSASVGASSFVGPANPNSLTAGATTSAITTYYIEFEVTGSPVTLNSTDVFPAAAGQNTVLEILQGPTTFSVINTINFTSTIASDGIVAQTVPINVLLTPGTYRMRISGGSYYRNYTSNAVFPYSVSGFSITGGSNSASNSYYFMYNLNIGNSCESTRTEVVATVDAVACLATTEIIDKDKISLYPNPFTDVVNVSNVRNVKSISVIDLSGRVVKTIAKPTAQINLSELKSGMYLINLYNVDGSTNVIKAIKK